MRALEKPRGGGLNQRLVLCCQEILDCLVFLSKLTPVESDSHAYSNGSACPPEQQQLNSSFDDETAALLNDCYTLEEKERLKEEWRLFEEQKRNFERERKNFTEAAIRLGREVSLL